MRRLLILGAPVFLAAPAAVAEEGRRRILLSKPDIAVSGINRGDNARLTRWTEPEDPDSETEVGAIHAGFVAVTPHRIDLNDKEARQAIEAWGLR
ncbi:MAG TPA: hypothetical protein VI669_06600 [Vicinamibacteria bacterium]